MYNDENKVEQDGFPTAIKSMIASSKKSKLNETRVWDLCLMYLSGQQNVRYDKSVQQYVTLRAQPGNQQLVINLILNMYRAVTSRLTTNYPGVSVMPSSPSNEDIIKAKSSEEALKYFYHRENVKTDLKKAIEWLVSTGNVALHESYDSEGDVVRLDVISPYDLFFEAGSSKPEESYFIAIRKIVRKEDLKRAYPSKQAEIMAATEVNPESDDDNSSAHDVQGESFYYPRVEIFDIYFKDGKYGVVIGDEWLFKGSNPTKNIPVQFIRYTDMPDRLWGMGMIAPILDLQNLYNKTRNQVLQNVQLMSNPKWLIPKSAGVNGSSIRGTPGEIIYYNAAGGMPKQVAGTPLPSYVMDNINKLNSEMLDVAGIHSTSLGKRAVGVTSGKAIQALASQDVSQLVMTQENLEDAVKKMAESVLELMKKYYTEERFMRMMDATGKLIFKKLSNTNLVDTPEIFIEAGSLFRDESQDRDTKVLEMLELGLIDKPTAMKEISFKTGNAYVLEEIAARNHVQEMLDVVTVGAQIEIFASDDLKKFKEIFGDFMKTDDYYDLPADIRDYMRDLLIAVITYQAPDPNDPATTKLMYQVFPSVKKPGESEELLQDAIASSPQAADQMLAANMENAVKVNEYQTQRGAVRQQPQGNDLSVINGRSTE